MSPNADRDIEKIVEWYGRTMGGRAARKVARTLQTALRATRTIHSEAATRPDLPSGYYRVVAKRHLVIFQIEGDAARIVRVIHGARDVMAALEEL